MHINPQISPRHHATHAYDRQRTSLSWAQCHAHRDSIDSILRIYPNDKNWLDSVHSSISWARQIALDEKRAWQWHYSLNDIIWRSCTTPDPQESKNLQQNLDTRDDPPFCPIFSEVFRVISNADVRCVLNCLSVRVCEWSSDLSLEYVYSYGDTYHHIVFIFKHLYWCNCIYWCISLLALGRVRISRVHKAMQCVQNPNSKCHAYAYSNPSFHSIDRSISIAIYPIYGHIGSHGIYIYIYLSHRASMIEGRCTSGRRGSPTTDEPLITYRDTHDDTMII